MHTETILRFRVVHNVNRGPEMNQRMIDEGYGNPLESFRLHSSFNTLEDACAEMQIQIQEQAEWDIKDDWKIIDGGETEHREVEDWF